MDYIEGEKVQAHTIDHGQSPWYKSDRALVNTLLDIGSSAGAPCTISRRGIHSCSIYHLDRNTPPGYHDDRLLVRIISQGNIVAIMLSPLCLFYHYHHTSVVGDCTTY